MDEKEKFDGMVVPINSNLYPYAILDSSGTPSLSLFPVSRHCFYEGESKAAVRNKSKPLTIGSEHIKCTRDPINYNLIDDYECPTGYNSTKPETKIIEGTTSFRSLCVITDELPPRCWTPKYGYIGNVNPKASANAIQNVVYECWLLISGKLSWPPENTEQYQQRIPDVTLIVELAELICPSDSLRSQDHLKKAPWLIGVADDKLERIKRTDHANPNRAPPAEFKNAKFFIFEHDRAVWPLRPKRKILISNTALYPPDEPTMTWEPGSCVDAKVIFSEFHWCYLARDYRLLPGKKLTSRIAAVEADDLIYQYSVEVYPSFYKGFYACLLLQKALISDPRNILRNLSNSNDRRKFPVWIQLSENENNIAKFQIAALNEDGYTPQEIHNQTWPDLEEIGFLYNAKSGAVYAERTPNLKIILPSHMRRHLQLGCFFRFLAVYHYASRAYLIQQYALNGKSINCFKLADGNVVFEEPALKCFSFICLNTHISASGTFGLVKDPQELVTREFRKGNNFKEPIRAYLVEDSDPHRETTFKLYALELGSADELDTPINDLPISAPTALHQSKRERCKCEEAVQLLRQILYNDAGIRSLQESGIFESVWETSSIDLSAIR